MKKRFSEEQIVAVLREGQAGQKTVEQLCRAHGIAQPTYYGWKRKYGSMEEPDAHPVANPHALEVGDGDGAVLAKARAVSVQERLHRRERRRY